jgi:hypothetical protein
MLCCTMDANASGLQCEISLKTTNTRIDGVENLELMVISLALSLVARITSHSCLGIQYLIMLLISREYRDIISGPA